MADNNENPVPPSTDKSNGKSSPSDENTPPPLNPQVVLHPPSPTPSSGETEAIPQIIFHPRCSYLSPTELARRRKEFAENEKIAFDLLEQTMKEVKLRLASKAAVSRIPPEKRRAMQKSMLQFAADMKTKMQEADQEKPPAKNASRQSQKPASGKASTESIASSHSPAPKTAPKPPQKTESSKAVTASIASSQSPAPETAPKPPQKAESGKAVTASTSGSQSSTAMTAPRLKVVNIDVVRTSKSDGDQGGHSLSDVWAGGSFKGEFQECVRRMLDTVEMTKEPLISLCWCRNTATDSPDIEEQAFSQPLRRREQVIPHKMAVDEAAVSEASSRKSVVCSINLYPDEVQPDVANVKEEEEKMDVEEGGDVKEKDDVEKKDDLEGESHKPKRKREA